MPGYYRAVPPGQKPFAHRSASHYLPPILFSESIMLPQTNLAHAIDQVRNSIGDGRDVAIQAGADLAKTGKSQVALATLNSTEIAPV